MKEYKIEVLRFIQKGIDANQLVNESKTEIQVKLDEYTSKGYRVSSMTTDSGIVYLLFEKEV